MDEHRVDPITDVLIESHRLQLLALVRRYEARPHVLATAWNVCARLRIDIRACAELVESLVEDGLVQPHSGRRSWLMEPLALTDAGRGYLTWVERRVS